jgi:hypothetical protein
MPLYVLVHKWKKENVKTVAKKVIEGLANPPEGACLCSSYLSAQQDTAWCVWEAKSEKQIKEFADKIVPEWKTEVFPVLQGLSDSPIILCSIHSCIA